ncbi:MAG: M48 family metalloprotease [Acidaminococcaceae bacterium]|nr:M48 family metalloprotease [Acidaminococcaceae bacterium]
MKHFVRIIVTILCVLGISCSFLPNAEAGMISEKQEIEMGKATAEQIEARYGVINDPQIAERVDRIGQSLVDVCGRKNIKYSFKVLNTEDVNALACPGGYIYIFKGLLDYMPSDAELAGVLGHEIGHVVKRHTVHQLEKNMWTQLAAILAGAATGNGDVLAMGMVVGDALAAGYSRADESAADREGFAYTVKAGYSPYAMLVTMHKLQELAAEYGNPGWGIFDSHPDPQQRIRNMYKLMDPLKMTPSPVSNTDGTASVKENFGDNGKDIWEFRIATAAGGNKPLYRAELLAGALYQVRQKDKIEPTHFIVFESNDKADIFYEDVQIHTIWRQDAAGFAGIGNYAAYCVEGLREWADKVNQTKTVAKKSGFV